MILKVFVKALLGNKDVFLKAMKINGKAYILKIEKYEPLKDTLEGWKECLDKNDLSKHS